MPLYIREALKLVLDLAEQNILTDEQAKGGMEDEQARQKGAIEVLRAHYDI